MTDEAKSSVNQRLNLIVDTFEKGIKSAFAAKIGISAQGVHDLLSGRKGLPSFKVLSSILENYPTVDANWLVLGRGEMLRLGEAASEERVSETSVPLDGQTHVVTPDQWELIKNPILAMTTEKVRTQVLASLSNRTYHFGDTPTPGLEYDDRISKRLNLSKEEVAEWLASPEFKKLPHTIIGKRIIVTEQGLREFLGDSPLLS